MNREFKRLIDDLKDADRAALRQINETPSNAWLCRQNVLWSLMRKGLINVGNGHVEVSNRGERVLAHIDYYARKH